MKQTKIDKEFLSNISVLYVEDDDNIRNSLKEIFGAIFKNVFIAKDGLEGLELFNKLKENNEIIDVVITDVSMPNLDGLGMIEKIKEIDKTIPTIVTTAHSDEKFLLSAIKLGINYYALKPVDTTDIILHIQEFAYNKYNYDMIIKQKEELEEYLKIIDKVAIVSKTDINGNITFVNEMFKDVTGYSEDEILGKHQSILRHPDSSKKIMEQMWEEIKQGNVWKGKFKSITKEGETFYVNVTVIPIFNYQGKVKEYIRVAFLTTEDEEEKREFKLKVIQNIKEHKEKENAYQEEISNLKKELFSYRNQDLINDTLENEKQRNERFKKQIVYYEKYIKELNQKTIEVVDLANEKVAKLSKAYSRNKRQKQRLEKLAIKQKKEIESKDNLIDKLTEELKEAKKTIDNLNQVIIHREEQLGLR